MRRLLAQPGKAKAVDSWRSLDRGTSLIGAAMVFP